MKSIQALLFRLALYTAGIFILALGTVLFTCGRLGTSALVSVPFITADITGLTLGTATTLVFGVMVILQLFLQRKLTLKTLLQLPFSFVFGSIVDFYTLGLGLAQFQPESLLFRILVLFFSDCCYRYWCFFYAARQFHHECTRWRRRFVKLADWQNFWTDETPVRLGHDPDGHPPRIALFGATRRNWHWNIVCCIDCRTGHSTLGNNFFQNSAHSIW